MPERTKHKESRQSKNKTLKILNINFQSLKTKQGEIRNLISSVNPDIIFGIETWRQLSQGRPNISWRI
jgi:hypothetical protein